MPEKGLPRAEVMQQLLALKQDDQDWRGGRVFSLVYSAGDEVHELLSDALSLFSAENGLNVLAFPSIGVMQHDIVSNTATLLGADEPEAGGGVEGYLTSGGTESLLQAVKTARDVGRERGIAAAERRRRRERPRRLHQGGRLLRRRPGAGAGRRGLPRRARRRWRPRAPTTRSWWWRSAPTYPQGVIDPIADIAALALRRGILCHVDACMGGYLLPFLRDLGRLDAATRRSTSGCPASRPCRRTCTSTGTHPRACR